MLKFVRDYREFGQQLDEDTTDLSAIGALAHKIAGAAGNLGLTAISDCAKQLEQSLNSPQALSASKAELRAALLKVEKFVEQYLTEEARPVGSVQTMARPALTALLRDALLALDTDNPARIETVLEKLAEYMPANQLRPLHDAVQNFDFRGGEQIIRNLLDQISSSAED